MIQVARKWTLARFRHAGRSHLQGAKHGLEAAKSPRNSQPLLPASGAYLAHVALESGVKAQTSP